MPKARLALGSLSTLVPYEFIKCTSVWKFLTPYDVSYSPFLHQ